MTALNPEIKKKLTSPNEDQRFLSWMILFQDTEDQETSVFDEVITHDDVILKLSCITFLSQLPEKRACQYLAKILWDENQIVIEQAVRAYQKNSFEEKVPLLLDALRAPVLAAKSYAIGEVCQARLVQATDTLVDLLKEASVDLTAKILAGLRLLGDRRVVYDVKPYLEHSEARIRFQALLVFAELYATGWTRARKLILTCAKDESPMVRRAFVWSLRRKKQKRNLKVFFKTLASDDDPQVRQECVLAIALFPNQRVVETLLQLTTSDTDRLVRLKAEAVLLSLSSNVLKRHLFRFFGLKNQKLLRRALILASQLSPHSKSLFKLFAKQLEQSSDPLFKLTLIEALGELRLKETFKVIEPYLDKSAPEAYAAARALAKSCLDHDDKVLIRLLEKTKQTSHVRQVFLKRLSQAPDRVRLSKPLRQSLIDILQDPNLNTRYLAVQGLRTSLAKECFFPLCEALINETDRTTKHEIANSLQKFLKSDFSLFHEVALTKPDYLKINEYLWLKLLEDHPWQIKSLQMALTWYDEHFESLSFEGKNLWGKFFKNQLEQELIALRDIVALWRSDVFLLWSQNQFSDTDQLPASSTDFPRLTFYKALKTQNQNQVRGLMKLCSRYPDQDVVPWLTAVLQKTLDQSSADLALETLRNYLNLKEAS